MFEAFPKISRMSKSVTVTEKIDGTNAQIAVFTMAQFQDLPVDEQAVALYVGDNENDYAVLAGSRNRWLDTSSKGDNFGFAKWVQEHIQELFTLGPGLHYGEWWGPGIGPRGYPVDSKRFSLFNAARWGAHNPNTPSCCLVVPIIGSYPIDKVDAAMMFLKENGSLAAPGFMNPEGIVIYHERTLYKKTFEHDEGKWSA